MPLILSEIDGTFQVAWSQPGSRRHMTWSVGQCSRSLSLCRLRFRPPETHPDCNISRVDTHCKHHLHCTECPFAGDDVYRIFIFNLLSPILNEERWIYEIQINKWINSPRWTRLLSLFSWCDGIRGLQLRIHNKNQWKVFLFWTIKEKYNNDLVLNGFCLWKETYLINVSDHLYSCPEFISEPSVEVISLSMTDANKSLRAAGSSWFPGPYLKSDSTDWVNLRSIVVIVHQPSLFSYICHELQRFYLCLWEEKM